MESEEYTGNTRDNRGYNSAQAIQIRLGETDALIDQLEIFLSASRINYVTDENGEIKEIRTKMGERKANPEGIFSILAALRTIINPHVVQGNFIMDNPSHSTTYEKYIRSKRIELTRMMMINQYKWEIRDKDMGSIIDTLMSVIEPFMSRLMDNKERESYESTMRHVETNNTRDQGGPLNIFKRN